MQPKTLAARTNVATRFVADMGLDPSTVVVDGRDANSGGPGGPSGPLGLAIVWNSHPLPVDFACDRMEVIYFWPPGLTGSNSGDNCYHPRFFLRGWKSQVASMKDKVLACPQRSPAFAASRVTFAKCHQRTTASRVLRVRGGSSDHICN